MKLRDLLPQIQIQPSRRAMLRRLRKLVEEDEHENGPIPEHIREEVRKKLHEHNQKPKHNPYCEPGIDPCEECRKREGR